MTIPYPQLETEGIKNQKILQAIRRLPRELFVSENFKESAYVNSPLPIDCGQTISQPFIVAYMSEKLSLKNTDKVLEIGTGSGFQTAVLAQLVSEVYTVEIYPELGQKAQRLLNKLGYQNIKYRIGDGKLGWENFAPFDKIIITAATLEIPFLLVKQLKIGGKMLLPLANNWGEQDLILITKIQTGKIAQKQLIPVRFVPLL
ncbi:MAG: protein-L-isoaspartate(D-aspartate) O-methyltransferase [Candidatus Moeniiplasma glomeromycotorum]|nr:protein-L-isoaspartate(D-aspartate) O-methyltransferase [Candidatus Moeniiplasma glomeromycotorum]